jgi:hypothetical protein
MEHITHTTRMKPTMYTGFSIEAQNAMGSAQAIERTDYAQQKEVNLSEEWAHALTSGVLKDDLGALSTESRDLLETRLNDTNKVLGMFPLIEPKHTEQARTLLTIILNPAAPKIDWTNALVAIDQL